MLWCVVRNMRVDSWTGAPSHVQVAVGQVVLLVRGAREGGQHVAGVGGPHEQPAAGLEGAGMKGQAGCVTSAHVVQGSRLGRVLAA